MRNYLTLRVDNKRVQLFRRSAKTRLRFQQTYYILIKLEKK